MWYLILFFKYKNTLILIVVFNFNHLEHLHQSIRTRTSTGKNPKMLQIKKKVLVFNCAKKLIFTFSSESIICNSSVQTPSPILLRTDCKVTYVGQVCKFSFFSTSKWNTSICKSLKIEKYMICNKEILWKTNSQKKKEKKPTQTVKI